MSWKSVQYLRKIFIYILQPYEGAYSAIKYIALVIYTLAILKFSLSIFGFDELKCLKMLVKHSHILEARELRDSKVILCYIRIRNRFIKYYSGQAKAHATHRWMLAEHWAKFDEHLEGMVREQQQFVAEKSKDFKDHTFWLNASIFVRVSRCRISLDVLKRCILDGPDKWNIIQAFEFFIENKENDVPTTNQLDKEDYSFLGFPSEGYDHEYKPAFLSTPSDNACVPYTPSTKIESTAPANSESIVMSPTVPICQQLSDEDRYSPKPIVSRSSPQEINESPLLVPTYKPSRMKQGKTTEPTPIYNICKVRKGSPEDPNDHEEEEKKNKFKQKKSKDVEKNKHISDKNEKKQKSDNKHRDKYKDKHSDRNEIRGRREDENIDSHNKIIRSYSNDQKAKENKEKLFTQSCDSNTDTEKYCQRKLVKKSDFLVIPHGSHSPMKSKRLLEDDADETHMIPLNNVSPKLKHKKSKTINEDLFGSEDDEANKDFHTKKIKISTKTSAEETSKDSTKNKRKHCGTLDVSSEQIGMDKWLGKKLVSNSTTSGSSKSSSSKHKDKRIHSCTSTDKKLQQKAKPNKDRCSSPVRTVLEPVTVLYPSREEIGIQMEKEKLQIERNLKVKEVLDQLVGPTPEKVDTLTIKDLSLDEVLNSFHLYKPKLDEVFHRSSKKPHQIKGYNGINHYLVMSLIDEKDRMAMMNTLQDAYEPDFEGISAYATLFINAMMPEWIICLFMDKHKLTREEAIKQVKAQDEYNLHLETQLESSATLV